MTVFLAWLRKEWPRRRPPLQNGLDLTPKSSPLKAAPFVFPIDKADTQSPCRARNISELCKSLICRHGLKNAGEVVLAAFFIGECDFDSMGLDLSGKNFAKTIAKDSGVAPPRESVLESPITFQLSKFV